MNQEIIVWIARDFLKCTGCRRCEIACSLFHEGKIWPEASRVRVFMLVPGIEIPHLCAQCHDHPCIASCPVDALSEDNKTGAILVDKEKCNSCGSCIDSCPGKVPFLHPDNQKAIICDLCSGDPKCARVCQEANFNALWTVKEEKKGIGSYSRQLFSRNPEDITKDVAINLFGEKAEELI